VLLLNWEHYFTVGQDTKCGTDKAKNQTDCSKVHKDIPRVLLLFP